MPADRIPPAWRLPEGVNASLWEYAHTPRLADEEDVYFLGQPLFETDARALDERFVEPGPLVDLGCGIGRLATRFAGRGFPVVAVELSHAMLLTLGKRARAMGVRVERLEANLCRLGCLPDGHFTYALSMFSTLGMIRGAEARRQALRETFRILRPGGRMALHAHNIWLNLRNPHGRLWLVGHAVRSLFGLEPVGDRRMTYRGIPGMEVHLYRWGELRRDLFSAGFRIDEVIPIDSVRARPIGWPSLGHSVRAGGWLVFASKPG